MNGRAAPDAGQLDAINQLHAQCLRCRTGFIEALEGVVIGQREHTHTALKRPRHYRSRRKCAV
jgi:hypothetical protein